jgi:dienelactone hydrolase
MVVKNQIGVRNYMCEKCKEIIERRGFLKSALASTASIMAMSLLKPESLSASVKEFPENGKIENLIVSEEVEFQYGENNSVKLFISRPKQSGKFKPILIGHGFGEATYLTYTATRFALAGYAAFAILEVKLAGKKQEYVGIGRVWTAVTEHLFVKDYVTANELALFGFCGAGTEVILAAAKKPNVKAVVTVYGNVTIANNVLPPGTIEKINVPIQSHFGLLDTVFPLASAKTYEGIIKKSNKKSAVYFYENCGHSYCNFSIAQGTEPGFDYNLDAAMKTYERAIEFFKKYY